MRVSASLLLVLALATGHAAAEPGVFYVTSFGRTILRRTDLLVEGTVVSVRTTFRGIATARVRVHKRLKGFDRTELLLLLYMVDEAAPDLFGATLRKSRVVATPESGGTGASRRGGGAEQAPVPTAGIATGPRIVAGMEGLFFLSRKAASYALVGVLPAGDPLFAKKERRLRDVLRIESITALDRRVSNAKLYFLAGLGDAESWTRGNAARELAHLAGRYREIFTEREIAGLTRRLLEEKEPIIRGHLERAARVLAPRDALRFAQEAEAADRKRFAEALGRERKRLAALRDPGILGADLQRVARVYGRGATRLLAEYLEHDEPLVRERAAQAVAEYGGPSAREPVRRALATEVNPQVAAALIYACGARGDPEAVALLVRRARQPTLERAALTALARIGTEPAWEALEAQRAAASGATRTLIDGLLAERGS